MEGTRKVFIDCKYSQKDQVKELGGKWNKDAKLWYFYVDEDFTGESIHEFKIIDSKYKQREKLNNSHLCLSLDVKYERKEESKELGCKWLKEPIKNGL